MPKLEDDCCDVGLSSSCVLGVDVLPKLNKDVVLGPLVAGLLAEVEFPKGFAGFEDDCSGWFVTFV